MLHQYHVTGRAASFELLPLAHFCKQQKKMAQENAPKASLSGKRIMREAGCEKGFSEQKRAAVLQRKAGMWGYEHHLRQWAEFAAMT
jgi:hypothetical protein